MNNHRICRPRPAHHAFPGTGFGIKSLVAGMSVALVFLAGCGPSPRSTSSDGGTLQPRNVDQSTAVWPQFTEATAAGLDFKHQLADGKLDNIMESDGAGGACLDYDGDGFIDVYLVNSGPAPVLSDASAETPRWPNRLYRNRGNGTFEDATERAGVAGHGFGTTAAAADYDNDGDTDLLVVNFGGLILYQNQGDGTFKDVTTEAGLMSKQAGISATFLDADRDGHLDLFVANYLVYDPAVKSPPGTQVPYPGPLSYPPETNLFYHNRGNGTFEEIGERIGIRIPGHRGMSVTTFDYDVDGDEDLYVSNDATPNLLLANDGQGHFQDVAMQCGVAFDQFGRAAGTMGAAIGDINGDGLPDMLVTRFGNASLYLNSPQGVFTDHITDAGILQVSSEYVGWGGNLLDIDNDGDLDVFIANGDPHSMAGSPSLLLANEGQGNFVNISKFAGTFFQRRLNGRGSGALDFNNDGRMDLLITTLGGPAVLLQNRGETLHHWLKLQLVGTRGNRDGFGARVEVTAGTRTWVAQARCPTSYVFQQDPRLHFGLGTNAVISRIRVLWPSGQTQELTQTGVDRILRLEEPRQL